MSESKSTPGPWGVQLCKGSYQRPALVVAGKKLVASCMGDQLEPQATSIGEAEANARLIAGAPDLLMACEESLRLLNFRLVMAEIADDEKRHLVVLRTAIAKAKAN